MAVIVILSLFLFIIYGDNGLAELKMMKKSRDSMVWKNQIMIQKNLSLCRSIERLKSDAAYIENTARRELGMVGKNEIIYKLTASEKGKAEP
jgi:cell division protein FtsB